MEGGPGHTCELHTNSPVVWVDLQPCGTQYIHNSAINAKKKFSLIFLESLSLSLSFWAAWWSSDVVSVVDCSSRVQGSALAFGSHWHGVCMFYPYLVGFHKVYLQ